MLFTSIFKYVHYANSLPLSCPLLFPIYFSLTFTHTTLNNNRHFLPPLGCLNLLSPRPSSLCPFPAEKKEEAVLVYQAQAAVLVWPTRLLAIYPLILRGGACTSFHWLGRRRERGGKGQGGRERGEDARCVWVVFVVFARCVIIQGWTSNTLLM